MPNDLDAIVDEILPPKQRPDAVPELDRIVDEILPPKTPRTAAPPITTPPSTPPSIMTGAIVPGPKPPPALPLSDEERQAKKAQLQTEMTAERAKQAKDVVGSGDIKTFYDVGDTRGEVIPYWGGVVKAADAIKLLNVAQRHAEARPQDGDQEQMQQYAQDEQTLQAYLKDKNKPSTMMYKIGSTVKQMIPFGVQLLTTAGIWSGAEKGAEKATLAAAEKLIEKAALSTVTKKTIAGSTAALAGKVAGAVVTAPFAGPGEIVERTAEEMMPGMNVVYDENGQHIEFDKSKAKDPLVGSLIGLGDYATEVFTEGLGGEFGKALAKVPAMVKLEALKQGLKARWLRLHPGKATKDFLEEIAHGAHWDGILSEMGEERVGEMIKGATGLDQEYAPFGVPISKFNLQEGLRNAMAEGLSFMVFPAASLAIQKGSTMKEQYGRGVRLRELTALREQRASAFEELRKAKEKTQKIEQVTDAIADAAKAGARVIEKGQDAERITQAAQPDVGVLNAQGTEEVPGQVPTDESGVGVSPRGQGQEIQAGPETVTPPAAPVETAPIEAPKPQARFIGYAGTAETGFIPLVNIPGPKGRERSVSPQAAQRAGFELPPIPSVEEWNQARAVPPPIEGGVRSQDKISTPLPPAQPTLKEQMAAMEQEIANLGDQYTALLGKPGVTKEIKKIGKQRQELLVKYHELVRQDISEKKAQAEEAPPPAQPKVTSKLSADEEAQARAQLDAELNQKVDEALPPKTPQATAPMDEDDRVLLTQIDERWLPRARTAKNAKHLQLLRGQYEKALRDAGIGPDHRSQALERFRQTAIEAAKARVLASEAKPAAKSAKPLSAQLEGRFRQALGRVTNFLNQVRVTNFKVVESSEDAGVVTLPGALATVNPAGEIIVIRPNFEAALKGMSEKEAVDLISNILTEEGIHVVIDRVLTKKELMDLWDSLPAKTQTNLLKLYSGKNTLAEAGMTAEQAAHEYIRGLMQMRFFGTRTEGRSNQFSAVTNKVLDALRVIVDALKSLAGLNSYADSLVARVDKALKSPNPAAEIAQEDTGESEGPQPAALVTTPERRRQELVGEARLEHERVKLINNDIAIQNETTVGGRIRHLFDLLPKEVQAHLPFVRTRLRALRQSKAWLQNQGYSTPAGDLISMTKAATSDVNNQSEVLFDAWRNIGDFKEESAQLKQRLETAKNELLELKKAGGVGVSRHLAFLNDAIDEYINTLINQRTALLSTGGNINNVSQINAEIDHLNKVREHTATFRLATHVLENPGTGPVDFKALGVNATDGNYLVPIFRAAPTLNAVRQSLATVPLPADVQAQEQKVAEMTRALQFTAQIMDTPQFKTNYRQGVQTVGAEAIVRVNDDEQLQIQFDDPTAPDNPVKIDLDPHVGVTDDNLDKLLRLSNIYQVYNEQPDDQKDPLKEAAYRRWLVTFQFWANRAFSPRAGKNMPSVFDPFHITSLFGILSTPETRLERIGGINAAMALMDLRAYDHFAMLGRTRFDEMFRRVSMQSLNAAAAHGMTPTQWNDLVANPLFAYAQEMGSVSYKAGQKYEGVTITQQDVDAVMAQKRYVDKMIAAFRDTVTTFNRQSPVKIQVQGAFAYFREAQTRGAFTMPKFTATQTQDYARQWARIEALRRPSRNKQNEPVAPEYNKAEARQAFNDLLGVGIDDQNFSDITLGHMRSATRIPSYSKQFKSPFLGYYVRLIEMRDNLDPNRPRNFKDVVEYIYKGQQNIAPEKWMSREQIADQMHEEIGKGIRQVKPVEQAKYPAFTPQAKIFVQTDENFLTNPRGDQVLPASLLEYTTTFNDQQQRIVAAINQVMGGRYRESLVRVQKELQRNIANWESRIKAERDRGVWMPGRKVRKETRQQQVNGELMYGLSEARHHLRQVSISLFYMDKMTGPMSYAKGMQIEEGTTATRVMRTIIGVPLLQAPGVLIRNAAGGPLVVAQQEWLMGMAARYFILGKPLDAMLSRMPGYASAQIATKMLFRIGSGVVTMFNPIILSKLSRTAWGKNVTAAIQANPDFWKWVSASTFGYMKNQKDKYERLRELGLAGGAPILDPSVTYTPILRLQRRWMINPMFLGGGRLMRDDPHPLVTTMRSLESVAGLVFETGLTSGFTSPRAALSKTADIRANIYAGDWLDGTIQSLQHNILLALAERERNGIPVDERTFLEPQELLGKRFVTQKNAVRQRMLFQKAGINIDRAGVEYYRKVKEYNAKGKPIDFTLLDTAQYNAALFVFAETANKGGFANRPELFTLSEWGRNFGFFLGYGSAMNDRFKIAWSNYSRSSGMKLGADFAEGMLGAFAMMVLLTAAAVWSEELLVRPIQWALWNEKRSVPKIWNAKTPSEAINIAFSQARPFEPAVTSGMTYMWQRLHPGAQAGGSQLWAPMPIAAFNSIMDTLSETADTGSATIPMVKYSKQWWPGNKWWINRLPSQEGSVIRMNLRRAIRAAAPPATEMRRVGQSSYPKSPWSDNVAFIADALHKPGDINWEVVRAERDLAIEQMRIAGKTTDEANRALNIAVDSQRPFKTEVQHPLTSEERAQFERRMAPDEIEDLRRSEAAFQAYKDRYTEQRPKQSELGREIRRELRGVR